MPSLPALPLTFSVIVPAYNEAANIAPLLARIAAALDGEAWEVIVVDDDSPDGTAARVHALQARYPGQLRCLRRLGRRGLASACVEGLLAASGEHLAVMDADLQHDPTLLRAMLAALRGGDTDLVIASRYVAEGSVGQWDARRLALSRAATRMARWVMRQPTPVSDPMSGYFALRRETFEACMRQLSSLGFKILLDILASSPPTLRIRELPYTFDLRAHGHSKLTPRVVWDYLLLLADKLVGRWLPVRFIAFASIGALGVGVHFAALSLLFKGLGLGFGASQAVATVAAMVFNFSLNNVLTYADQRLRGGAWWRGLGIFSLVCGLGASANVGVADYLFGRHTAWPLAALAGMALSTVWNYAVTARYAWRR